MDIALSIGSIIVILVMGYIIYSDQRAEQFHCKRIKLINVMFLAIGVILWNVFYWIWKSQPHDLFEMILNVTVNLVIVWFFFGKNLYLGLIRMPTDCLSYSSQQKKEMRKTYIRNVLFLIIFILLNCMYRYIWMK